MSRYRSRRREWSVNENSVKRTGSTGCRSLEVPVWYPNDAWLVLCIHANQAVHHQQRALQLMCGDDQRTPTRNGLCRPFQCVIGRFHRRTIIRPSVITMELLGLQSLRIWRDNLCSNLQCVEDFSTRVHISHM